MDATVKEQRVAVRNSVFAQLTTLAGPEVYTQAGVYINGPREVQLDLEFKSKLSHPSAIPDGISVHLGTSRPRWYAFKNGVVNVQGIHKAVSGYIRECQERDDDRAREHRAKVENNKRLKDRAAQLRERLNNAEFTVVSCTQLGDSDELFLTVSHPAIKTGLTFRATSTEVSVNLTVSSSADQMVWMARKVRDLLLALENLPAA